MKKRPSKIKYLFLLMLAVVEIALMTGCSDEQEIYSGLKDGSVPKTEQMGTKTDSAGAAPIVTLPPIFAQQTTPEQNAEAYSKTSVSTSLLAATPTPIPELKRITATYKGEYVVIDEEIDLQLLTVTAYYSNGTNKKVNDYDISDTYAYEVGTLKNTFYVWYEDCETTFKVTGREPLEVKSITATYNGPAVFVSDPVDKKNVVVNTIFNWSEVKSEKTQNFTIEPEIIEYVGDNEITVYYEDLPPVVIHVTGKENTISSIEAKYIGSPVEIGGYVAEEDIEVVAKYSNGKEELVDDFRIITGTISNVGVNTIKIYCKGKTYNLEVEGFKDENEFREVFQDFPVFSDASTIVSLLVSRDKRAETIGAYYVEWDRIQNAVSRVCETDNFLGFEVLYDDPDAVLEFPLYARVTRPDEFDPDRFALYYSRNGKTIMAKVRGEFVDYDKTEYVFKMYEPGIYIMVDEVSSKMVNSINIQSNELKMKVNRSYALDPIVLPEAAENRELLYTSTDEYVATVSDKGKIKTLAPGECYIYIEATDGSGVYEEVHLVVTEK